MKYSGEASWYTSVRYFKHKVEQAGTQLSIIHEVGRMPLLRMHCLWEAGVF